MKIILENMLSSNNTEFGLDAFKYCRRACGVDQLRTATIGGIESSCLGSHLLLRNLRH
jgi:hypothetical protein